MTPKIVLAIWLVAANDAGTATGPRPLNLGLPAAQAPTAAPAEYRLERQGDGSYVWDSEPFSARISRDGTVKFDNHVVSAVTFLPFLPTKRPANDGPSVESVIRDWLSGRKAQPVADPRAVPRHRGSRPESDLFRPMSADRPDPSEACVYPRPCSFQASVLLISVAGRMDLNDYLFRLSGEDPYRYEKARFLGATSQLRSWLAARDQSERMRTATDELPRMLERIARDGSLTAAERIKVLEQLRDETDVSSASGRAARARIEAALTSARSQRPEPAPRR